MNHPTQEQFKADLKAKGFRFHPCCGEYRRYNSGHGRECDASNDRHEPPAERWDCDEMPLGVPRG